MDQRTVYPFLCIRKKKMESFFFEELDFFPILPQTEFHKDLPWENFIKRKNWIDHIPKTFHFPKFGIFQWSRF